MGHALRRWIGAVGPRRGLGWLALAVVAMAWWFTLAPSSIGGPASYIIVVGTSMEPGLSSGDLVVTRAQRTYGTGDVLAFAVDGGQVIHRALTQDATGSWTTQGDNRATPDGWQVADDAILGAQWFTVEGFAAPSSIVRLWWFAPATAALTAFLLLLPSPRRRRPEVAAWLKEHAIAGRPGPKRTTDVVVVVCCAASVLVCSAAIVTAGSFAGAGLAPVAGAVAAAGGFLTWGGRGWGWWGRTKSERVLLRLRSSIKQVDALPAGAGTSDSGAVWGRHTRPARSALSLARFAQRERMPVLWLDSGAGGRLLVVGRQTALTFGLGDQSATDPVILPRAVSVRRFVGSYWWAMGLVLVAMLAVPLARSEEAALRVYLGTVLDVQRHEAQAEDVVRSYFVSRSGAEMVDSPRAPTLQHLQ